MVRPSGRQICDPVDYLRPALLLAQNGILVTANGDYDDVSQPRETVEFTRMSRFSTSMLQREGAVWDRYRQCVFFWTQSF